MVFVLVPGGRSTGPSSAHLGTRRLSLPDEAEAKAATGYERGATTPFGARTLAAIADAAVATPDRVAIGAGARGVNFHMGSDELLRALEADVVDVTA
jgi:prolyl-tRNA editing enzyme YbaK/EbsC (Cys-tRNA(Pro) deacylase)